MGYLYGFDLVVPRVGLRRTLVALAHRACADGEGCRVLIPGEPPLHLPFRGASMEGELDEVDLGQPPDTAWLDAMLWLPLDDVGRGHVERSRQSWNIAHPTRTSGGVDEAAFGEFGVFVVLGTQSCIVRLAAAGARMSDLFEASEAVRFAIASLAEAAGGFALLSREHGHPYEAARHPGHAIAIERYDLDEAMSIDDFARAVDDFARAAADAMRQP